MRQRVFSSLVLAGALLFPLGCATKRFVRQEVQKSEVKVGQQLGQVETELSQERERIGTVTGQVTEARAVAEEATKRADHAAGAAETALTRAGEAGGKASEALAKAEATDSRFNRLWTSRNRRAPADSLMVTFGFNRWDLDDRAQTALLDVVKQLRENPDLTVDVEGYTDGSGPRAYNVELSQRRAEAVRRFLVESGVDLHRIQYIGLGEARPVADNQTRDGRGKNRRVTVRLFTPSE